MSKHVSKLAVSLTNGQTYYITHTRNLESICKYGILSHRSLMNMVLQSTPIYNHQIVERRRDIYTPAGLSLWSYCDMYLQPRNPMLYQVMHELKTDVCVLAVDVSKLDMTGAYYSDGNAAHAETVIKPVESITSDDVNNIRSKVNVDWWSDNDSSKRQIMAELLIPNSVQPEAIRSCYIPHGTTIPQHETSFTIISNPHMFFQNSLVARVTPYISLMSGDMFFSNMSTMTVAVNSIGVMGKGLAATCKYRFPDAYVRYQDFCRTSKIQLGQCALYKRNRDLDADLSYDPLLLSHVNSKKWFLFFPTKNDWRHNSTLEGIEQGMQWLLSNYKKEGITSIALPALGCGLGKLKWEDVGPVMCKYLNQMNIQCEIFLPSEQNTNLDPKSLTAEYLIRS